MVTLLMMATLGYWDVSNECKEELHPPKALQVAYWDVSNEHKEKINPHRALPHVDADGVPQGSSSDVLEDVRLAAGKIIQGRRKSSNKPVLLVEECKPEISGTWVPCARQVSELPFDESKVVADICNCLGENCPDQTVLIGPGPCARSASNPVA